MILGSYSYSNVVGSEPTATAATAAIKKTINTYRLAASLGVFFHRGRNWRELPTSAKRTNTFAREVKSQHQARSPQG